MGESFFRGDGHTDYGGAGIDYRVLATAEFDWDGHQITAFQVTPHYGPSHRDYYIGETKISSDSKTATSAISGAVEGPTTGWR
jgi:hypothetical protein